MTPKDLYNKIGFESIEKLKAYGNFIGKDYTGDNLSDCYRFIFGKDVNAVIRRRALLLSTVESDTGFVPNKVWTFGCMLVIGSNFNEDVENKVSSFDIPLGPVPRGRVDLNKRCIIQLTPNQNYYNTEVQLVVNIMEHHILLTEKGEATLKLVLNTTAKTKQWDNNEASVYLTVFIYENEVLSFKST
jgi:hypothetical protein